MQPIYNSHSAGGRQAGASCSVGYHKRAGADEAVSAKWQRGVGGVGSVCSGTNLGRGKKGEFWIGGVWRGGTPEEVEWSGGSHGGVRVR